MISTFFIQALPDDPLRAAKIILDTIMNNKYDSQSRQDFLFDLTALQHFLSMASIEPRLSIEPDIESMAFEETNHEYLYSAKEMVNSTIGRLTGAEML